MRPPTKRAYTLRGDEIERLRTARGWNLETLSAKADINLRTLGRILDGKPAYLTTAARLAAALNVDCKTLLDGYTPAPGKTKGLITLRVSAIGDIGSADQIGELAKVMEDIVARMATAGIRVHTGDAEISKSDDDDVRIIVRIDAFSLPNPGAGPYGFEPVWMYAAIRPAMYQALLDAHETSTLALSRGFERYGTSLIGGWGYAPPRQIVRAVERFAAERPQASDESD